MHETCTRPVPNMKSMNSKDMIWGICLRKRRQNSINSIQSSSYYDSMHMLKSALVGRHIVAGSREVSGKSAHTHHRPSTITHTAEFAAVPRRERSQETSSFIIHALLVPCIHGDLPRAAQEHFPNISVARRTLSGGPAGSIDSFPGLYPSGMLTLGDLIACVEPRPHRAYERYLARGFN